MLKTIVHKQTGKEYKIQVKNLDGENAMVCPVCSSERKKSEDECFYFNASLGAGRCNHNGCVFYEKKSTTKIKRKKIEALDKENTKSSYIRKYFQERKIPTGIAISAGVTTTNHYFKKSKIEKECICFNYFVGQEIIYKKFRTTDKLFSSEGVGEFFYNHNSFVESALFDEEKYIIITEGEEDCLCFIAAGFKKVVSVPCGNEGTDFLDKYKDYFEKMDKIYLALDQDEAGYLLEQEIIRRYNTGCCYKVDFKDKKDANEYLKEYGKEELKNVIENAILIPTDGIIRFNEVYEKAWRIIKDGYEKGMSTGYPLLDELFTWRTGEVTLFSGYGNHGKTTFLACLTIIKAMVNDWKWAIFTPEYGDAEDFYLDMAEIYLGKTIVRSKFNKRTATDQQVNEAFDFIDEHFFFVYPKDEVHNIDTITKEVAANVKKHGINGVIIDPFNQLHRKSENVARDIVVQQFCRKGRTFALRYNLAFAVVVHPKTAGERDPKEPNQYCLEEGDSWNKAVNNLCTVHRPYFQKAPDSTRTIIHWWKIKRQGKVGRLGSLIMEYNPSTYRYYQEADGYCPFPTPPTGNYTEQRRKNKLIIGR